MNCMQMEDLKTQGLQGPEKGRMQALHIHISLCGSSRTRLSPLLGIELRDALLLNYIPRPFLF